MECLSTVLGNIQFQQNLLLLISNVKSYYMVKNCQILVWNSDSSRPKYNTHQIPFGILKPNFRASSSKARSRIQDVRNLALYCRTIPNRTFTSYNLYDIELCWPQESNQCFGWTCCILPWTSLFNFFFSSSIVHLFYLIFSSSSVDLINKFWTQSPFFNFSRFVLLSFLFSLFFFCFFFFLYFFGIVQV